MGKARGQKLPTGITKRTYATGKETLYIFFSYKGVDCREPLSNRPADKSNIAWAERYRGEILNKIKDGSFKYADYFPDSKKLQLFGNARSNARLTHYLNQYIAHAERRGLKPSTINSYKSRMKELDNLIGKLDPKVIDGATIRDLAIQMNETIGYNTIRHGFKVLRGALDEAVMDNLIPHNPMLGFKLAKYVKPPQKNDNELIDPFNPKELDALIEACRDETEELLVKIWVKTGLRTGEIAALTWPNINLKRGYIKIRENYVSSIAVTGTPKTSSGIREVDLDDEALEVFGQQRLLTGLSGGLVFINPRTEGRFDSYSIRRVFVRLCETAKVRYRYAYNLRHTFATIKISQGMNLWELASQMGHSSPDMIFQHYGSFIKEYEEMKDIFGTKNVKNCAQTALGKK